MLMTAMDVHMHKVSLYLKWKTSIRLCVQSPDFNVYFNNMGIFGSGNGGESSTEQDFYGGAQGPSARSPNSQQSSPHRSLSGQSSSLCCIELFIKFMFESKFVFPLTLSLHSKLH